MVVARVAEARSTAAEAGIMSVGAAAFDAAEKALHAAQLAELASTAAADAQRRAEDSAEAVSEVAARVDVTLAGRLGGPVPRAPSTSPDDVLRSFSERADRTMRRLRKLERLPLAAERIP